MPKINGTLQSETHELFDWLHPCVMYSDVTGNSVTCKKSFQVYSITFSQGPKTEKEMVAGHRCQSTLRKHVLLFKYKRNIFLQWI